MQISSKIMSNFISKPVVKAKNNANVYMQNPIQKDVFERTTRVNFKGTWNTSKEELTNTVADLKKTGEHAKQALEGQIASDGWAGKTADWISGLWNSKNRAHIVKADIDIYQQQVQDLSNSIKENKFEDKFKEIFKVEYNPIAIRDYNKKLENFTLATTSHCVFKIVEEKINSHLVEFENFEGKLQDKKVTVTKTNAASGTVITYNKVTKKEEILSEFEKTLTGILGGQEWLEKVSKSHGVDLSKATEDEKYKVYGQIGKYLIETTQKTAKDCSNGKNLEEIKTEYEEAYKFAFGTENDIQERVDKYNRSQEIGAAAVRGVVRSGLVAATVATAGVGGIAGIAVGAGATFSAKMLAEITDKATNKIDNSKDLSKKVLAKMAKSAAISSADYIATRGLKNLIPDVDTGCDVFDAVANTGKNVLIDTTSGMVGEYFKQGKWYTNQIGPRMLISLTFNKLGKDNPITKELMSLTKGGVNQAMKKSLRDYDSVKTFVNETKKDLEENYIKNPEKYSALKLLSMNNPALFENLMVEELTKYSKEQEKGAKDSMTYSLPPEENID